MSKSIIGVQFARNSRLVYCLTDIKTLALNTICVVDTKYGLALGQVVKLKRLLPSRWKKANLKRIIRVATEKDKEQYKKNLAREQKAYQTCRQKILEKKIPMRLINVVYSLDVRKAVFYFTADNRVDFRELVKDLAKIFKTKIEMRQIGVRDEARHLGGVGCCGQQLCCCAFLKDFISVSIRMAKDQNCSLNPGKVSGICGRLMCCLAFEHHKNGKPGSKNIKK